MPLLAFLFLPLPETVSSLDYSGYTSVPVGAPIALNACEAEETLVRGAARSTSVDYGTAFTISGVKPASEVRIRFDFVDTHFVPQTSVTETVDGAFAPGARIDRTRHSRKDFHQKRTLHAVAAVLCVPEEVRFSDGTVWDSTKSAAMPRPGASVMSPRPTAPTSVPALPAPAPVTTLQPDAD